MTYKEATRQLLLEKYEKIGKDRTIAVAKEMLKSKSHRDDLQFTADLHGEICECVLEIILKDLVREKPGLTKHWQICKGVILKNRNGLDRDFTTEMDLVLLTPECFYLFECKSYSGDKTLTGQGKLTRSLTIDGVENKRTCDVYRQSVIHKETFYDWMKPFVLKGREPVIQMCMFDFSLGELTDLRSRASRIELPCLNAESVVNYVTQPAEVVWDVRYFEQLCEKLRLVSEKLGASHLAYVKQLHGED